MREHDGFDSRALPPATSARAQREREPFSKRKGWLSAHGKRDRCPSPVSRRALAFRLRAIPVRRTLRGCILWRGYQDRDGYGRIWHNGVRLSAHRLSWMLHHGAIPDGLHVLHDCDETACVAIGHLYLGTHQKNMADRGKRGRTRVPVRAKGRWSGRIARVAASGEACPAP